MTSSTSAMLGSAMADTIFSRRVSWYSTISAPARCKVVTVPSNRVTARPSSSASSCRSPGATKSTSFLSSASRSVNDLLSSTAVSARALLRPRLPQMHYGKVLYPTSFGATLVSLDSAAAEAMPGVRVVCEGDFVGVTAPDPFTAGKAVAALKADWKPVPAEASSKDVYSYFKKNGRDATDGAGLTAYTVAYIAHVPLRSEEHT